MELLNNKEVKVGNYTFTVKLTARAMIEFESLAGCNIAEMDNTDKVLKFFYTTAKAGAKANNTPFEYTYDSFIDMIDSNVDEALNNFMFILNTKADAKSGGASKKVK